MAGWSEPVQRAITNNDVTATGVELLNMGIGIRLLPVEPDDKKPIVSIVPHGVADATDDVRTWQQWLALAPDAGLGIVPGPEFAVLDDDRGDLDPVTFGVAGTYCERSRRGKHYWMRVPHGRRLGRAKIPAGDVLSGDRCYVVSAPTVPYCPVDLAAPILTLPADSPLWEVTLPGKTAGTAWSCSITARDYADAESVLQRLRSGRFAKAIDGLFTGEWRDSHPEWSESERDASLVFSGTHFLRDHPRAREVLFALLWATGWPQDPARRHPKHNPAQYVAITVNNALEERQRRAENCD